MKNLLGFLKKYTVFILFIIVLLFAQASLELSLPDYMSRIVNVGIQQKGVESPFPEVIRESQVNILKTLMTDEEVGKFETYYVPYQGGDKTLLRTYPLIETESVYKLEKGEEFKEEDLSFVSRYLLLLYGLQNQEVDNPILQSEGFKNLPEGVSPLDAILNLPEAQRNAILDEILTKIDAVPQSTVAQTATLYTQQEYSALGANLSTIQTNFVLMAGVQMIGIALLAMVMAVLVSLLSSRVGASLSRDMRFSLFEKVASFGNKEYNEFSTASLITRSTNDIQQIQMFTIIFLRIVFFAPILGVGGIIKALGTNKSMAWVIAVGVMAILTLVVIAFSVAMPKFKVVQKMVDKVNMVVRDSLVGMLVIRAFNTEKHEEKKFQKANADLTRTNLFVSRLMSGMQPGMMLVMNGIGILIVWVGSIQVDLGTMQVGDMIAYIQYTAQIMMSFLMLSMVSIILPRATVSINRVNEVLNKEISIVDPINPKTLPEGIQGEIEFRNVSFKYPGAEKNVLSNLNFTAHHGQTTAFIGSTGSGKSTLVNLIPRFYDVTEGEIRLNGINIKEIALKELRDKVAFISQEAILFSGTAESNIKYAQEDMSDEKMKRAARIAQAEDFIMDKDEGYGFSVSRGGANVSGGQRQRLAIARALATDAEAIIFDDSFSALDYKTDATLRATLKKEVNNTVIVVAQRISTIQNADQIIVLDEGKIVGKGTHRELLKDCEVYKEIASSQLSKEELVS